MNFKVITFHILSATILFLSIHKSLANVTKKELKCENEGCYEVIKTFAQLLEEKINETDKILAEAEKELNEVTYGNDDNFRDKLNEINLKLSRLIIDMNTGIDGGEETLMELVNNIFKSLNLVEKTSTEIEIELADGKSTFKITETQAGDINEVIMKIQKEFHKLENSTTEDLAKAIQDAFDSSEKFQTDTKDLREILDKIKLIIVDYENNLVNAKMLTLDAIEKFTEIDKKLSESERIEKEIEQIFKVFENQKFPFDEFDNLMKNSDQANIEAESVINDAFDLLNEVTLFNIDDKINEIEKKVNDLENYTAYGDKKLKEFIDDSSQFLDKLEGNLDAAESLKEKSIKQIEEIKALKKKMENMKENSEKSIKSVENTVEAARNILKTLEDFTLKVEESREMARRAFEQIPEIIKKIQDATEIAEALEDGVDRNEAVAKEAKEKSTKVRDELNEILQDSDNIKTESDKLVDKTTAVFDEMRDVDKEENRLSGEIDHLKKSERETENMIDIARSKSERAKFQSERVNPQLDETIKNVQELIAAIESTKIVDENMLNQFELKLNEAEDELEATQLRLKVKDLKEQREKQNELIENYKVQIALLEHEITVIRENVESLSDRCLKRTKLEP